MCFEMPLKIVEVKGRKAKAKTIGGRHSHRVSLELLKDIKVGDYVMVQGGFAISKVEKEEIQELIGLLKNKNTKEGGGK